MTQLTFAERLKEDTRNIHDSVDETVMSVRPFDSVENYIKFLNLQSVFHKIVDPIYKDPALNQSIENLASMTRYDAVPMGAKAIGWLYCAEGSNIGAAFLFKDTKEKLGFDENFGASHLDAHPDGRGKHWKAFRESLNQLNLSKDEQDTAIQGATEAFEFYKVALKQIFG